MFLRIRIGIVEISDMFDIFSQSLEMCMQFHESAVCWDRGKVAELSKCVLLLSCFYVLRVEDTDEA